MFVCVDRCLSPVPASSPLVLLALLAFLSCGCAVQAGTYSGTAYSGGSCSGANSQSINNGPTNTCGYVAPWKGYAKISCSGSSYTITSFSDSSCSTQVTSGSGLSRTQGKHVRGTCMR